jgi:hypothetical protein
MAPSVAPATSAAGTDFKVASRRVNLDGQVSAFSPVGDTNLPATITPQSYAQLAEYLADQVLISNDGGTTWKLVPDSIKGAQSVPTYSASWTTVVNLDNQTSVLSSLELGNFSALSNPEVSFFVLNTGAGVQSFTYSFIDLITNQPAAQYCGLIEVTLDGVYSASGSAPSSLYNGTIIWSGANSLNTQRLVLGANQFAKLRVRLINFPAGGFSTQEVNLSMQIVANQTSFTLGFAEQWPNKTFQIDLDKFPRELFAGLNNFSIIVKPFMVNYNGRLLVNWFDRQINFGASAVERWIAVLDNGNIRAYESELDVPTNSVLIGHCSTLGSAPWIDNIEYSYEVRPDAWGYGGGSVDKGLFVSYSGAGLAATSDDNAIGVSLGNGLYASNGRVLLKAGETLVKGDLIRPGSGGKAVTPGGYGVVLEDGDLDDLVLVELARNRVDSGGGGGEWGSITGTLADQTDLQDALDDKQPLDNQLTSVASWSDDQVSRAGNLPSDTSGAIEKTGANTLGTFTVTAAAKTVLDDTSVSAMLTTLGGAPLVSPALTGTPTVPTAAAGTNTDQTASTAFVQGEASIAKWNADKLQGADIQDAAPTNGQILVYSTANSRWEPKPQVIVLPLTPLNGFTAVAGWVNAARLYANGLAVVSFGVSRASQPVPGSTGIFTMSGYKARSDAGNHSTHEMTNETDLVRVTINGNGSTIGYFRVSGNATSVTLVGTLTFPWEVA